MGSVEAVVIGGGQAGLAASHHLSRRGIEHFVLERGRVGETWRSQRWDTFALNTPRWMSWMPGEPEDDADGDMFLSSVEWVDRLEAVAARDRVPIRERTAVTAVRRMPGGAFVIQTEGAAGPDEIETRAVVVASGTLNVPRIPQLGASLPSDLRQLSTGDYRRAADLPAGAVLVVGSAQSGVQIAEDLVVAGRTVYLATSAVARVPRRYRGRDMFHWLELGGFFEHTVDRLPPGWKVTWPNPQTSGVGPGGHTVSLQSLEALGVRLLGRPASMQGRKLALDDTLAAAIEFGDRMSVELREMADRTIADGGIDAPAPEPDAADAPHRDPAAVRSPTEIDLDAAGIASVIWTTGFTGDFSYLPREALDDTGRPIHRLGSGRLPNLQYLGLPWLRKRRSGIIDGLDEDGAALAEQVAAGLTGN